MKNLPLRLLEAAVVIAIGLLVWSNVTLRRQNAALMRALEQTRRTTSSRVFHPGERFEYGGLVAPNGGVMTPGQAPAGRQLVLVIDPRCGTCEEAASDLRSRRAALPIPPVVVSIGNAPDTTALAQRLGLEGIMFRAPETLAPAVLTKFTTVPQVFVVTNGIVTTVCGSVADCAEATSHTPRQSS